MFVNYRPEYRHEWSSLSHYLQLRLDPLPAAHTAAMLAVLLGDGPSLAPLKLLTTDRAAGNPFFIEEMVRRSSMTARSPATAPSPSLARAASCACRPPSKASSPRASNRLPPEQNTSNRATHRGSTKLSCGSLRSSAMSSRAACSLRLRILSASSSATSATKTKRPRPSNAR
jgi:hypothetical protein